MKEKDLQPRTPNNALIQIQQKNQKLYRQGKAKRIQHHQTNFATNTKGTSLGGKEKATTTNKYIQMRKLTGKGKHTVKVGNHLHTNILSKPAMVRRAQMQETGNTFQIKRPAA